MKSILSTPLQGLVRTARSRIISQQGAGPYICTRCLSSSRPYRSQTPTDSTAATLCPPSKSYAFLPTRRLLSIRGTDASQYLQGAITQNISPAIPRSAPGFYAAFLNAQGRALHDVFIYVTGEAEFLVEVDANEVERLYKHIKRYKLRSKFDVRLLEAGEYRVWSSWDEGEKGEWTAHGLGGKGGSNSPSLSEGLVLPDTRAPGMGRRLILPKDQKPAVEAEESTERDYRIRRYLKGVPEGQSEIIRETALPQESCIDYMGGIDYRKGCYVGQELTIRTHHTGVVRKRILPVMVYGEGEEIPTSLQFSDTSAESSQLPGESSLKPVAKRGRSAGKWLAGVGNIGLALCRLEMMTDVNLGGEGTGVGYKEGDEFKVEWQDGEQSLKVKAFVPGWHLNR